MLACSSHLSLHILLPYFHDSLMTQFLVRSSLSNITNVILPSNLSHPNAFMTKPLEHWHYNNRPQICANVDLSIDARMIRRYSYLLVCAIALLSLMGNMRGHLLALSTADERAESQPLAGTMTRKGLVPLSMEDLECSPEENTRKSTFRCPIRRNIAELGDNPENLRTHDERRGAVQRRYMENMISMYNGTDRDLFLRCVSLPFPLKHTDPPECWPRPVILPSFPTSGNGLFRLLLQNLTFPIASTMVMYKSTKTPVPLYKLSTGNNFLAIHGNVDDPAALPLMNRVVVFKSHLGANAQEQTLRIVGRLVHDARSLNLLFGILRLARNPGDNILRNTFRWQNHKCYEQGDKCFFQQAPRLCSFFANSHNLKTYARFHTFWNDFDPAIPQTIVHYEHITSKKYAGAAVGGAMEFLNSLMPDKDYSRFVDEEKLEMMTEMIREPEYAHGTLLARVCGKHVARKVNDETQKVSEQLGYIFDYESATWSLDPQKLNFG